MVGVEFVSCWLKIGRAEEHFSALKAELAKWLDIKPYSFIREHNPETGRHSLIAQINGTAPFDRFALMAGDCAHNLRCALDHLVYALAIINSGQNPPPKVHRLQFPICDSPEAFKVERDRIKDLSKKSQDFIESVQPYQRTHPELPPILGVLNVFENSDKHRLIHLTYDHHVGGKVTFFQPVGWIGSSIRWLRGPLENGKEFMHFTVGPDQPQIPYNCEITFTIGVSHIPAPSGRTTSPLEAVLEGMFAEVKRIVNGAI